MKIKLSEIVDSEDQMNELQKISLPVKVSYRIKRLADKLQPILKSYHTNRNELIASLGEKGENNAYSILDADKFKEFTQKLTELTEIQEEIDFEQIAIDELGEIQIPPNNLVGFIFK